MIFDINTLISATLKKKAEQKLRVIEYKRVLKQIEKLRLKASESPALEFKKGVLEQKIRSEGNIIINLRLSIAYAKNVLKEELKIAKLCMKSVVDLTCLDIDDSTMFNSEFQQNHPEITEQQLIELKSLYVCGTSLNNAIFKFPKVVTYSDNGISFHKGFNAVRMEYLTEEKSLNLSEYTDRSTALKYIDDVFGKYSYASNYIKELSENIFVYTDENENKNIVFVTTMNSRAGGNKPVLITVL